MALFYCAYIFRFRHWDAENTPSPEEQEREVRKKDIRPQQMRFVPEKTLPFRGDVQTDRRSAHPD
jgi:hypothetical protein